MANYFEVLKKIQRGKTDPCYLFYGEESYLQATLAKTLKKVVLSSGAADFNYDALDGKEASLSTILASAETLPVMSEKRLVMVKNAMFFSSNKAYQPGNADVEVLVSYLEKPNPSTCLVFMLEGNVDARKKITKLCKRHAVEVELKRLRGNVLTQWIKDMFEAQGKKLDHNAIQLLLTAGNDLTFLEKEIEKMVIYAGEETKITGEIAESCLSQTVQGDIFKLVDAIGERRADEALRRLQQMLLIGEKPLHLLIMIARQLRLMLQTKVLLEQGYSVKQIGGKTGIHPMVLPKIIKQAKNFSVSDLEDAIMEAAAVDRKLKQGFFDAKKELEFLTMKFCDSNGISH